MIMKRTLLAASVLAFAAAAPLAAQQTQLSVEPYVGYNFFGSLPESNVELQSTIAYGGRVAYQIRPQWALYGNFQRSNPEVVIGMGALPIEFADGDVTVDQWSAGVEFSYVPRGGAEGMLPIQIEAGLGQTRYAGVTNDLAVKLGVSSAIQVSPRFAVRYGVDDYISNYRGDQGIVNQFTARVGAEFRF
jgi:hypothetical protein